MRPSRRSVLGFGSGLLASALTREARAAGRVALEPTPIDVRAYPLDHFQISDRARRVFDSLSFRGGVELQSATDAFGGFAGLWRSPDGERIVAVTDHAYWLTARVETRDGRLAGLADVVLAPVLDADGGLLHRTRSYDVEALAVQGGTAFVGIERTQEVRRFDWDQDGVRARGQPVPLPAAVKAWPQNKGIEALGVAPAGSPLGSGTLVIVAERARWEEGAPTQGLVLSGPRQGAFEVVRSDAFEITDLAFLETGEMLLLERRFSLLRGVAARIRRIAADAIRPGALLDGPVIFEAGGDHQIDNLEGMALHRAASGETVLTLISDNNFSVFQRTLLLEFTLADD